MKRLFIILSLFVSVLSLSAQTEDLDAKYAVDLLKPGTKAPAIMYTNKKGEQKNILEEGSGKYRVVEFWASWCGDCRRDMKYVRRINRVFHSDSITVIGYSFDKDSTAYIKCRKDSALVWNIRMSPITMRESPVAKEYHLNWIPTYYLLDKDGTIILSTVMIDKIEAKLWEIAPNAKSDDQPLSSKSVNSKKSEMMIVEGISKNLCYPVDAEKYGVEAKVNISFIVEKDGSISDVKAEKIKIFDNNTSSNDNFSLKSNNSTKPSKRILAKHFFAAADKALRSIKKSVWLEASHGVYRYNMHLPVTFRLN